MTNLPTKPGVYRKGVVKCAADDCDRMTRSNHASAADYPGTFVRSGRGMCPRHYVRAIGRERSQRTALQYPILPCTDCGHLTRSTVDRVALAPGTRRRISKGRCTECVKAQKLVVAPEKVEAVRSELDGFLAARQKRQAVAARRQMAQRLRVAS